MTNQEQNAPGVVHPRLAELVYVVQQMYQRASDAGRDLSGKSEDSRVSVSFPLWWDDETPLSAVESVMIYSYVFGPSRTHYFNHYHTAQHPNDYTWNDPDPVACAIRVVTTEWAPELFPEYNTTTEAA